MDTAAFDEGVWHGLQELASGPPILLIVIPLVLCSVATLLDGSDQPSTDANPETTSPPRHRRDSESRTQRCSPRAGNLPLTEMELARFGGRADMTRTYGPYRAFEDVGLHSAQRVRSVVGREGLEPSTDGL